jgi:transcription antitermination protein NusB
MISRRKGREAGMQILYAIEVGGQVFDAAVHGISKDKENPIAPDAIEYGILLARCVMEHKADMEARIQECANHYDLERIAVVDRLVLSVGIAELLYFPEVPIKVAINEAIDIVKKYSTGESSRFVNGVLDAIARKSSNLPSRKDDHAP